MIVAVRTVRVKISGVEAIVACGGLGTRGGCLQEGRMCGIWSAGWAMEAVCVSLRCEEVGVARIGFMRVVRCELCVSYSAGAFALLEVLRIVHKCFCTTVVG